LPPSSFLLTPPPPTQLHPLSLHDALPILTIRADRDGNPTGVHTLDGYNPDAVSTAVLICEAHLQPVIVDACGNPLNLGRTVRLLDRKSTRLNSSHVKISYAVFCLKKKNTI